MLLSVPNETLLNIFRHLSIRDILNTRSTCSIMRECIDDAYLWHLLASRDFPHHHVSRRSDEEDIDGDSLSYRRIYATERNWSRGSCEMSMLCPTETQWHGEHDRDSIFSVIPFGDHSMMSGGSLGIHVWDLQKKDVAFRLSDRSGLCLHYNEDQGVVIASDFRGSTRVWKGFRRDGSKRGFLENQRVRYLKKLGSSETRDMLEKSEIIDHLVQQSAALPPTLIAENGSRVAAVDCLIEENSFLLGKHSGIVERYSLHDGTLQSSFMAHHQATNCIRRCDNAYWTCGSDAAVKCWDVESGTNIGSEVLSTHWLWVLDVSEQHNTLVTGGVGRRLSIFDMRTFGSRAIALAAADHDGEVAGLAVDWPKNRLVTSSFDGLVRLFDARQLARPLHRFAAGNGSFRLTRACMTDDYIAAGCMDGQYVSLMSFNY